MTQAEIDFGIMLGVLEANHGAKLKDQDDGNLVVYSAQGQALWSSGFDNAELRELLEARKAKR